MKILFKAEAFIKQNALIATHDHEVCWYGLVDRIDDETFIIEDILVHPQNVTSASVRINDEDILEWTASIPDEIYNKIKFSGHSHVKMNVFRSYQDEETEKGHAQQLPNGSYYIFVVANQFGRSDYRVYIKENDGLTKYDDVEYDVIVGDKTLVEFRIESEKNINCVDKEFNYEFSEEQRYI